MFALALENLINKVMASHIYSFDGKIYRQKSGGAIGKVLTRALATCYMVVWARLFREKIMTATVNIVQGLLFKTLTIL